MKELVQIGQAKIATPSKLTKGVGDVAQFILSAKSMVDLAIENIPQAALPWAGVCVGLQILLNPAKATKANLAGITHVVSRMDWYCALTELLLKEDSIEISNETCGAVLRQLEEKVVALYKALLLYQMKSICSYYRHQGLVFLRGLVNCDDWDADLKNVKDAEETVQGDSDQYNRFHAKFALGQLIEDAKGMEGLLGDIYQTLREFASLQKEMQLDDIDRQCRWDLRVIDPKDDMKKIEIKKDKLVTQACKWIFDTDQYVAFTRWSEGQPNRGPCRLLKIKGFSGQGKTMLLIGIIRELESQQDLCTPGITYFFYQGTDATLNKATTALRSLIWMLLVEQPHLISHLRKKYTDSGPALFQDRNAFFALCEAFQRSAPVPYVFYGRCPDECDPTKPGREEFIQLMAISLTLTDKVKWLVSSRREVDVLAKLQVLDTDSLHISQNLVDLDTQIQAEHVDAYIDHKLTVLTGKRGYDKSVMAEVSKEVRGRGRYTFLWVSLAFKVLEACPGRYAVRRIRDMPSGLAAIYDHMMKRIENSMEIDPQDCKRVLVGATLAFRPLSLSELAILTGMPLDITATAVDLCDSFLITRDETVLLFHQSGKDYLQENFASRLQPAGAAQGHAEIGRRSIEAMSSVLKRNIYELDYDSELKDMSTPCLDPLAPISYACVFWADHLCCLNGQSPEYERALADDGAVHKGKHR
ncbi:Vegetative incompatibility protein HET-E-1 [Tolypocladium ophioglossoides CBS 100239]|uniref:Vegetative incompatibility protein HET-E-1 n=1 Tax=Tolypocladium ophioglossoides (strain CBS 100239) TaxID=1163406 RepID=A0A0L0NID0_TOLOC|nr:Vegetative incompatibility protein HET-E-1 [Tolypocladium ophioglossoides CBS 100239]